MAVSTAAAIGAAAIGAGAGLIGNGINNLFTNNMNNRNAALQAQINRENIAAQKEINQQNLDFIRAQTQAQWERDDSAYQRQVADLEAAGLSPLAGSGPMQSNTVSSPNLQAAQQYPAHFQAPQFDVNSIVQSANALNQMYERHNENISKQGYRTSLLKQKADELSFQYDELTAKNVWKTKDQQIEVEQFLKTFGLQSEVWEHTKKMDLDKFELERFCKENQAIYENTLSQLPDKNIPHKYFDIYSDDDNSLKSFETAQRIYQDSMGKYMNSVSHSPQYKANARNNSMSGGGSAAGTGLNASASSGNYSAESKDSNQIFAESWSAYCNKNDIYYPIPVYRGKRK